MSSLGLPSSSFLALFLSSKGVSGGIGSPPDFFLLISLADLCGLNDSNGPLLSDLPGVTIGVGAGFGCFRVVGFGGAIPFFGIAGLAVGSCLGTLGYSSLFPRL